jgi:Xaa-Pro aminopeptidase
MPDLPFPEAEYRARAARVRVEMARRDIDVLFVMSPPNLTYLTGFESIWYPPRAPVGVAISRHDDRLVFLDYERHENHARNLALFDDAVFYRYDNAVEAIGEAFAARGWNAGTVGIEWWTTSPGAPLVRAVADRIGATGARVVEGSWTVDRVRAVKSPLELESVRTASMIVDAAITTMCEAMRPGLTELQVAAIIDGAMADLGGEAPAVWCRTHGAPGRRPVAVGDAMYVDVCGVYNRYHVDVCRTFAIGRDIPAAREILDYTAGSVAAVVAGVRPGDPLDVAQRIAEDHVFARYPRESVWWVGGYALGIALPPNWVGHTYLANDAFEQFTWEPGYVTNYENILFDRERGFTASYMETLLMGADGIEILSSIPRTLAVIGA